MLLDILSLAEFDVSHQQCIKALLEELPVKTMTVINMYIPLKL
jgi:hypothetical protein